jgi:simple sugar transport system ATP-binding protein
VAQRFGLTVQPEARVGTLSVGERQRVEILKALYRGARILILDEPTAAHPAGERGPVRHPGPDGGAGPVHHLHQPQARRGAARLAPRGRAAPGKLVAQATAADTDAQLAQWMVGQPWPARAPPGRACGRQRLQPAQLDSAPATARTAATG